MQTLVKQLTQIYEVHEARAILRIVIEDMFHASWTHFMLDGPASLTPIQKDELRHTMERLLDGTPIQYITGYADFCGHRFRVTPATLIPRPETEELVHWIVSDVMANTHSTYTPISILDIGTGTGCIAISLAHYLQNAKITASDFNAETLRIASYNTTVFPGSSNTCETTSPQGHIAHARNDSKSRNAGTASLQGSTASSQREETRSRPTEIKFLLHDILSSTPLPLPLQDIIVSNPPYVCRREAATMHKNVLAHEPHSALFVPDDDPLLFYRAIARHARTALAPGGRLYLEINQSYPRETSALLASEHFHDITLRHDRFGKPRMIRASLANC